MIRTLLSSPQIPKVDVLYAGGYLCLDRHKREILALLANGPKPLAELLPGRVSRRENIEWLVERGYCFEHNGMLFLGPGVKVVPNDF